MIDRLMAFIIAQILVVGYVIIVGVTFSDAVGWALGGVVVGMLSQFAQDHAAVMSRE